MNTGMKMMVLANRGGNAESKYRDRRGREHRENGEYAVRNYGGMDNREMDMVSGGYGGMEMGMDNMESRRRRDSRGRFRSEMGDMNGGDMRMDYDMESRNGEYSSQGSEARMGGYPNRPFPVYEGGRSNMNQIGFDYSGDNVRTDYGMTATHHTGNEMEYRKSSKMGGYSYSEGTPMTKEMAEEWTRSMRNEDGTKGPHWTMEQVKQVMAQKGIKYDLAEFYAILNAMYSDYCAVLKKHGVNNIDFYVDLAAAWLNDSDSVPNKAALYYECIVKHD